MKSARRSRSFGLYVLIVDEMGSEILNACMKMTDLGKRRIALVERLELARKPMLNMEAIYVMKPDEDSVHARARVCAWGGGGTKYLSV